MAKVDELQVEYDTLIAEAALAEQRGDRGESRRMRARARDVAAKLRRLERVG